MYCSSPVCHRYYVGCKSLCYDCTEDIVSARSFAAAECPIEMGRHIEDTFRAIQTFGQEQAERQLKWDRRWLEFARDYARKNSKDPSTQTGAVIIGPDGDIVSAGYNGFARKVKDLPERYADRETKYMMVVHCEVNAVIFGDRQRMKGATLYTWPFMSCSNCAAVVIQAGIKRCVAPPLAPELAARWEKSVNLAKEQFEEAGVELSLLSL